MAEEFNTEGMLDMYLFENSQLLERLQDIVLEKKDEDSFDEESINEIFRTMHTIKGSSGIMMFDEITSVSHKLEDVFYYLRESNPPNVPHLELVEHVLTVADFITAEMEKIQDGLEADGDATVIIEELDKLLKSISEDVSEQEKIVKENVHEEPQRFYIAPMATSASHFYKIKITYHPDIQLANVHAYKIIYSMKEIAEDLLHFPEDIISDEKSADIILKNGFKILLQAQISEEELRTMIKTGYDIDAVEICECTAEEYLQGFEEETDESKPKAAFAPGDFVVASKEPGKAKKLAKDKPKKIEKAFISVDVAKMDMLMDLIGELVIAESVVLQNPDLKVPGLKLDNFSKAAAQMSKISTDLQDVIMSMRMVPLTNTFQKMNRIVFDVSRKLGKDIEFEMIGEQTEVDKNIIEHISDPLMHLVRNAVDHGIETKEEREASGKSERAKVTLSAKTESGKVWIGVQDNGKGMDRKKIYAKAKKQGITNPAREETSYSDKEIFQFITAAGFSTKEKVTEYSGRGVGMDVVVSNLQEVGGTLDIESELGKGSTMYLKIPLTLAIIDGIVMRAGDSSFVIETGVVKEFVRVTDEMMYRNPNGEEFVMIRGEGYPVLRLAQWYNLKNYNNNVSEGMMIIVEADGKSMAVFVEELIGKQEIVVKPIPSYIKKVRGLSGCTQLGDGSIALILDAAGLIE